MSRGVEGGRAGGEDVLAEVETQALLIHLMRRVDEARTMSTGAAGAESRSRVDALALHAAALLRGGRVERFWDDAAQGWPLDCEGRTVLLRPTGQLAVYPLQWVEVAAGGAALLAGGLGGQVLAGWLGGVALALQMPNVWLGVATFLGLGIGGGLLGLQVATAAIRGVRWLVRRLTGRWVFDARPWTPEGDPARTAAIVATLNGIVDQGVSRLEREVGEVGGGQESAALDRAVERLSAALVATGPRG